MKSALRKKGCQSLLRSADRSKNAARQFSSSAAAASSVSNVANSGSTGSSSISSVSGESIASTTIPGNSSQDDTIRRSWNPQFPFAVKVQWHREMITAGQKKDAYNLLEFVEKRHSDFDGTDVVIAIHSITMLSNGDLHLSADKQRRISQKKHLDKYGQSTRFQSRNGKIPAPSEGVTPEMSTTGGPELFLMRPKLMESMLTTLFKDQRLLNDGRLFSAICVCFAKLKMQPLPKLGYENREHLIEDYLNGDSSFEIGGKINLNPQFSSGKFQSNNISAARSYDLVLEQIRRFEGLAIATLIWSHAYLRQMDVMLVKAVCEDLLEHSSKYSIRQLAMVSWGFGTLYEKVSRVVNEKPGGSGTNRNNNKWENRLSGPEADRRKLQYTELEQLMQQSMSEIAERMTKGLNAVLAEGKSGRNSAIYMDMFRKKEKEEKLLRESACLDGENAAENAESIMEAEKPAESHSDVAEKPTSNKAKKSANLDSLVGDSLLSELGIHLSEEDMMSTANSKEKDFIRHLSYNNTSDGGEMSMISENLNEQDLSNTAWAFTNFPSVERDSFLHMIAQTNADYYNSMGMVQILYVLAKTKHPDIKIFGIKVQKTILRNMKKDPHYLISFTPTTVSSTSSAGGKVKEADDIIITTDTKNFLTPNQGTNNEVDRLSPRGVANIIWALASGRVIDKEFNERLGRNIHPTNILDICNIAWGFWVMKCDCDDVFENLARRALHLLDKAAVVEANLPSHVIGTHDYEKRYLGYDQHSLVNLNLSFQNQYGIQSTKLRKKVFESFQKKFRANHYIQDVKKSLNDCLKPIIEATEGPVDDGTTENVIKTSKKSNSSSSGFEPPSLMPKYWVNGSGQIVKKHPETKHKEALERLARAYGIAPPQDLMSREMQAEARSREAQQAGKNGVQQQQQQKNNTGCNVTENTAPLSKAELRKLEKRIEFDLLRMLSTKITDQTKASYRQGGAVFLPLTISNLLVTYSKDTTLSNTEFRELFVEAISDVILRPEAYSFADKKRLKMAMKSEMRMLPQPLVSQLMQMMS